MAIIKEITKGLIDSENISKITEDRLAAVKEFNNFYRRVSGVNRRRPPLKMLQNKAPEWAQSGLKSYKEVGDDFYFITCPESFLALWLNSQFPNISNHEFAVFGVNGVNTLLYVLRAPGLKIYRYDLVVDKEGDTWVVNDVRTKREYAEQEYATLFPHDNQTLLKGLELDLAQAQSELQLLDGILAGYPTGTTRNNNEYYRADDDRRNEVAANIDNLVENINDLRNDSLEIQADVIRSESPPEYLLELVSSKPPQEVAALGDEINISDGAAYVQQLDQSFIFDKDSGLLNEFGGKIGISNNSNENHKLKFTGANEIFGFQDHTPLQLEKIRYKIFSNWSGVNNPSFSEGTYLQAVQRFNTVNGDVDDDDLDDIVRDFSVKNKYRVYPQTRVVDDFLKPSNPLREVVSGGRTVVDTDPSVIRRYLREEVKKGYLNSDDADNPLLPSMRRAIARKLRSAYHVSYDPRNNGYHIVPDIKLRSKNEDVSDLGNLIYEDEDWYVFSYPTAAASHIGSAGDFDSLIAPYSDQPSVPGIAAPSAPISMAAYGDAKPLNGGSLYVRYLSLQKSLDDGAELTEEDKALLNELKKRFSGTSQEDGSFTYNIRPASDSFYPSGVGTSCNQGIGVALLFRAKIKNGTRIDDAGFFKFGRPVHRPVRKGEVFVSEGRVDNPGISGDQYTSGTFYYYAKDPLLETDSEGNLLYKRNFFYNAREAGSHAPNLENSSYLVFLHYDYDDKYFKDWYDEKDVLTVSPINHQGYSPTNKTLITENTFVKSTINEVENYDDRLTDYFFDYGNHYARNLALRGYPTLLHSYYDLSFIPKNNGNLFHFSHSGVVGPNPLIGPQYSLMIGDDPSVNSDGDLFAIDSSDETRCFYGNRHIHVYDKSVITNQYLNAGYWSRTLMVHPTNLVRLNNSERFQRLMALGGGNILTSEHVSERSGNLKLSDSLDFFFKTSSSIPINIGEATRSKIPLKYVSTADRPAALNTLGPQVLDLYDKIVSANIFDTELYIGTDDEVRRVSLASLISGQNIQPFKVVDRGVSSNIVSESTVTFAAKDSQLFSFKYFEEAKGYLGEVENTDFKINGISKILLFIQDHNLAVVQSAGSKEIFILTLGKSRKTHGFSRFSFTDEVIGIDKVDDHKLIVYFKNQPAGELNFNVSEDEVYLDDLADLSQSVFGRVSVTKQKYKSRMETLPLILIKDPQLNTFDQLRITYAAICVAGTLAPFTFGVGDGNREVVKHFRANTEDLKITRSDLPIVLRPLPNNSFKFPIVSLETESDKAFSFSSIILGEKFGQRT